MDDNIDDETEQNFNKANIILTYIFSVINFSIIMLLRVILKSKKTDIQRFKNILFSFIIIHSISKLLYLNLYNYFNLLVNEIIYLILSSYKLYLILSFIYRIFNNTLKLTDIKNIKLINPIVICFVYIFILFPYDEFVNIYHIYRKMIIILEYSIIIFCLHILYKYIKNIIVKITRKADIKKIKYDKIYLHIQILNTASLILFIYYYISKLISMFIYNKLYLIYLNISTNIFNESLKYLFFYVLFVIIYILNKNNEIDDSKEAEEEIEVIIKN